MFLSGFVLNTRVNILVFFSDRGEITGLARDVPSSYLDYEGNPLFFSGIVRGITRI
jgi:hypothetical protein